MANCNNENKLTLPLNQVCDSNDIGCIDRTNGKPTWIPTPDQLPLALDDGNSILWVYDCQTNDWISFDKGLCANSDIDISGINQVCDILKVPVYYELNGSCTEGGVTLQQFADRLAECLNIDTDVSEFSAVVINPHSMRMRVVEDTTELPLYFLYENLTVSGSGTDIDPIVIAANPPICDMTNRTAEVQHGNTTVGACVDGNEGRIDPLAPICETPNIGDLVDGDEVVVCDGAGVRQKNYVEPDPCASPLTADLESNDVVLACGPNGIERKPYVVENICDSPDGGSLKGTDRVLTCRGDDIVKAEVISAVAEACNTRIRAEDNDELIEVVEEASCGECCGFVIRSKCPEFVDIDPDDVLNKCENLKILVRHEDECISDKQVSLEDLHSAMFDCCIDHTFPTVENACIINQIVLITDNEGCQRFAISNESDLDYPPFYFNQFTHGNYPANTYGNIPGDLIDPALVYTLPDLLADDNFGAGTVDDAKVMGALLVDTTYDVQCASDVLFTIELNVPVSVNVSKSTIITRWSYDNGASWNYTRAGTNDIVGYPISSFNWRTQYDLQLSFNPGTVMVQYFLVEDGGLPPTQVIVNSTPQPVSGQLRLQARRVF